MSYRSPNQTICSQTICGQTICSQTEQKKFGNVWERGWFSQQEVTKGLGMKQYNISRRPTKGRETLLLKFASYCKESLHICLNLPVLYI